MPMPQLAGGSQPGNGPVDLKGHPAKPEPVISVLREKRRSSPPRQELGQDQAFMGERDNHLIGKIRPRKGADDVRLAVDVRAGAVSVPGHRPYR